jgi:hypothetical protein
MEYSNGRAIMIEWDMAYVLYLCDFRSEDSRESLERNVLFGLRPPGKAAWLAR